MDRLDDAIQSQAGAFVDDTRTWEAKGLRLSDRVWSQRADMRSRIDQTIRNGILNGDSVDDVANELTTYIRPTYARFGSGKASYAANRLASHETRRASALGTQATALTDPAGGYLRYTTSPSHAHQDECDTRANHEEGFGRGVYPAKDCPLPPEHVGCRCSVTEVGVRSDDMNAYVDQLRVEYGLDDPPDLSPEDMVIYRRETAKVRDAVTFLFRAWFEQVGLVTTEQLAATSPTVRQWVNDVRAEKRRGVRG